MALPHRRNVDMNAARAAKAKVADIVRGDRRIRGIGISRTKTGYVIKVNFGGDSNKRINVPDEVDGVPVITEFVGDIIAYPESDDGVNRS